MVGPGVLTFVKELGELFGSTPAGSCSASSTASRRSTSPAPASSSSTAATSGRAIRAMPATTPPAHETFYRDEVGVDDNGAAVADAEGRLHLQPHVRLLGDAATSSRRRWTASGYQGVGRPRQAGRGDRGADQVGRRQRAPAGRQDLQRQDPPGLRPPEHLQGRRAASSTSSTAPRSRTASTAGRGGLHEAGAVGRHIGVHVGRMSASVIRLPWARRRTTASPLSALPCSRTPRVGSSCPSVPTSCSPSSKAWSRRRCWR